MAAIVTITEVGRSAEDVFAYATDPTHFHEWQQGVIGGYVDQPGPAVGAHCRTTRRTGGTNRPSTSEGHTSTHRRPGASGASMDPSGPSSTSPSNP